MKRVNNIISPAIKAPIIVYSLVMVFLFFFSFPVHGQTPRIVVNTGHSGKIQDMAFSKKYNLLFSGGEDGTVRAWNPETGDLVYQLQVSHLPVETVLLNPQKPYMAVVERGKLSAFRLSVWNWQNQDLLFSRDLEEFPLDMSFSPRGSFLVYSRTSWDSLTFLDSDSGRKLYYMNEGFGIVSGLLISPSERTIMTYSPAGSIQYRDVRTGSLKTRVETAANLGSIEFTEGMRYMAAASDNKLLLIDLVSGKTVASYPAGNIKAISINTSNNIIACHTGGFRDSLSLFSYSSGSLLREEIQTSRDSAYTGLLFSDKKLYAAGSEGTIHTFSLSGEPESPFSTNNLLSITGMDFHANLMVLASNEHIVTFDSDFFTAEKPVYSPQYLEASIYDNPMKGETGITAMDLEKFVLWKKAKNERGKFLFFNPENGEYRGLYEDFSSPLTVLDYTMDKMITLEGNGGIRIINPDSLTNSFEYTLFGLQDIVYTGTYLLAGKNRLSGFPTPLVRINAQTGEILPIQNKSMVIYALSYNPAQNSILTLGLENTGSGANTTTLEELSGAAYQFKRTLYTYPGEDLNASVVVDHRTGEIYTSLGFTVTKIAAMEGFSSFQQKERIPRTLYLHNSHLYSLNKDSSITVWDKNTGRKLMDFFIFRDKNWIALLAGGRYYSSDGAEQYISVYSGNSLYRGSRNFRN